MTKINCNDKNCNLQKNGVCTAEEIEIYTSPILTEYSHAECMSFKGVRTCP